MFPRITLGDRVSGQVTPGCRTGRKQLLAPEDEHSLVQYCSYCAQHGFPLNKALAAGVRQRSEEEEEP